MKNFLQTSIIITLLVITAYVYPCMMELTNDTDQSLMIITTAGSVYYAAPGQVISFGSSDVRAHFFVFYKQGGYYVKQYELQQIACSADKSGIQMNASEINGEEIPLFIVRGNPKPKPNKPCPCSGK